MVEVSFHNLPCVNCCIDFGDMTKIIKGQILWFMLAFIPIRDACEKLHPGIFTTSALWPWPWRFGIERNKQLYELAYRSYLPFETWPGHKFWLCVHPDLEFGDMILGWGHDISSGHGQQFWFILSRSWISQKVMDRTRILAMCVLWPWPWRYDLMSRSWHILGSWTIIGWNNQIRHCST